MNILLVNPPIRETYPPYIHPVGLMSVATILQEAGHCVQIFDINAMRCKRDEVASLLPPGRFDWIGIGGLITTYDYLLFLVPLLRKLFKNTAIVVGGGGITSAPKVYMENIHPDVGALGEGEYTALELSERKPLEDILGITYFLDGEVVTNQPRPLERDLDKFPMVNYDLIDVKIYAKHVKHNKGAPNEFALFATRGCHMACHFCYHVFGRGVRYRSVGSVIAELEYLMENYDISTFSIQDECFTARKSYVQEFSRILIDKGYNIGWHCYSRLDTLDEETMCLMRKAGCFQVGFGIESGSQAILDAMNKNITVEKMRETYTLARKHFPRVSGTLIMGYPGENDETLTEGLAWLKSVCHVQAPFFIQPYPGTQIYIDSLDKIMEQHGSEHNYFRALGDASQLIVNLTEWTNEECLERRRSFARELWDHRRTIPHRSTTKTYDSYREPLVEEALNNLFGCKPMEIVL